ncbi:uncharacterized protein LOC129227735 [Uloborus diversus]|uniref:uncharacterized protein LOC129227735 n=1 Tax=Uloborus diversus TaxID=327109 RepID=UPI0024094955|nr:uncharacterized protein LOC129227735 [Uloborus diversus]
MFIKSIAVFLGVIVVALAEIEYERATKRCWSQSDCDPLLECCSKRIFEDEAYCVQRRRLNEICLDNGMSNTLYNGLYDISCPCFEGLECRKEIFTVNGRTRSPNPRCVPSYGYYPGATAISGPYSYANAGGARAVAGYGNEYSNTNSESGAYSNAGGYYPYAEENGGELPYSYREKRSAPTAEKK